MKNFKKHLFATIGSFSLAILVSACLLNCNKQNKEIVILYTNDVHGRFGEEGKLSYPHIAQMKKDLKQQGKNVLLVDAGDHLSGSLNAVYDHGETVKNLMNAADYDVASLGNHEFDNDFPRLYDVIATAKYDYLCCNLYHADSEHKPTTRFVQPSKIFEFPNCKLGIVGIITPDTISDSTPEFFKDYYFKGGEELYKDVQTEVDYLKEEGCDVVIALAHLGMELEHDTHPSSSKAVIEHTNHIDALIDGHSHFLMPKRIEKNKDGQDVIITQTGSYFEKIGRMDITIKNGGCEIDTQMIEQYPNVDTKTSEIEKAYIDKIEEEFGRKIAETDIDFWKSMTGEDTNLSELCSDAFYYCANHNEGAKEVGADVAFVNRGGIRDYITPGEITVKKCRQIFSFDNSFVIAEVTGEMLWQGLEYAMRGYPEYVGGAIIPAGLKCDVDCSKHAEFTFDPAGGWVSGPNTDEHRVDNIKIYNPVTNEWDDFDMNATYNVAGSSYILKQGGDGLNMFGPNHPKHKVVYENDVDYDYMCLVDYIESFTKEGEYPKVKTVNSPLSEYSKYLMNYEYRYGANRYNFINQ